MRYNILLGLMIASNTSAQQSVITRSISFVSTSSGTSTTYSSSSPDPNCASDNNVLGTSSSGTYNSDTTGAVTPSSTISSSQSPRACTATGSSASTTSPGTTAKIVVLVGGVGEETMSVINGTKTIFPSGTALTQSSASISSTFTNSQSCNNYPEFCDRKYSNITEVCAHNSMFVKPDNAASNQAFHINAQLDDGVRMIQGETHYENDTIWSCHTSCDLLNMGPYQDELVTIRQWVEVHPYDVVTILVANSDFVSVDKYVDAFQNSGLGPYLYEPPMVPLPKNDWPTLSELVLSGKRVVVFMDYNANQTAIPYILDQYSHIWETPFSPQDDSFPCTIQRPDTLTNQTEAKENYMYLANHNLNQAITLLGSTMLVPDTADINNTNAAGYQVGMLGATINNCTAMWDTPPNWLVVDYYNVGNGSVFEAAARCNNVTYSRPCCGSTDRSASSAFPKRDAMSVLSIGLAVSALLVLY